METNILLLESMYLEKDLSYINEGLGDIVKNLSKYKEMISDFIDKLKTTKDANSFKKISKVIPKIEINQIEIIAKKRIDNYEKNKEVSIKLFKNEIPSQYKNILGSIVAVLSDNEKTRNNLIKKVNNHKVDWKWVNKNVIYNLCMSLYLTTLITIFAALNGLPIIIVVTKVLAILLVINLIGYMIDVNLSKRNKI